MFVTTVKCLFEIKNLVKLSFVKTPKSLVENENKQQRKLEITDCELSADCEKLGWVSSQEDCGYSGSAGGTSGCWLGLSQGHRHKEMEQSKEKKKLHYNSLLKYPTI